MRESVHVCVCVCVREREREREGVSERVDSTEEVLSVTVYLEHKLK